MGRLVVLILVLVCAGAFAALWVGSEAELRRTWPLRPETARAGPASAVPEGLRLAKLYGCTSCHGADFGGHAYNDDPKLVRRYAPNLTAAAARYSDAQLAQAIRQGVRPADLKALWHMPSATFATVSEREMSSVLAAIRAAPPVDRPAPRDQPGLQARWEIIRGAWIDRRKTAIRSAPVLVAMAARHPPRDLGAQFAQGRHIARTVCAECHGHDLAGDGEEGGPDLVVASAYDLAEFTRLMRTGVASGGRDAGFMSEVARDDFHVFTDAEIAALHAYLVARASSPPG